MADVFKKEKFELLDLPDMKMKISWFGVSGICAGVQANES